MRVILYKSKRCIIEITPKVIIIVNVKSGSNSFPSLRAQNMMHTPPPPSNLSLSLSLSLPSLFSLRERGWNSISRKIAFLFEFCSATPATLCNASSRCLCPRMSRVVWIRLDSI